MSRSVKKGPYVAPELLKRVEEMNAKNDIGSTIIVVGVDCKSI